MPPAIDRIPTEGADRHGIMSVSALLRHLRDTAPDHFTLKWLMSSMPQQSFGVLLLFMALVAAAPLISLVGGLLLLAVAIQMVSGCSEPTFPSWVANRSIAKSHLRPVLDRALPILKWFEKVVHPRLATPAKLTKRLVGAVVMLLTIRLLVSPFPMSNIPPSLLIAVISLAYVERDGLLLLSAVLASCILLGIDLILVWQLRLGVDWIAAAQ